ncbi:MAG TPA: OmpW family outer membrane protein [Dongiaceae bacterium]|nr:OmpW family outer membrane protein [Dongiaceae bacterium]
MLASFKKHLYIAALCLAATAAAGSARSDEASPATPATTPAATPAPKAEPQYGKSAGDFMVRLRGIDVIPRDHGSINTIGGSPRISNEMVPEVDFSYFITDYIALELIAATSKHDVSVRNSSLGNVDLGSVWLLPPTLTLQFHPLPKARFSPYIGGGINYTIFYNAHAGGGVVDKVSYSNSIGYAAQVGIDVRLAGNWYLNADLKHLWLNNKVKVNGSIKAQVSEDPWIAGIGFGYKF